MLFYWFANKKYKCQVLTPGVNGMKHEIVPVLLYLNALSRQLIFLGE